MATRNLVGTQLKPEPAYDPARDERDILIAYKSLLRDCMPFTNKEERRQIRRAFEVAAEAHFPQRRKSGEPYILHPLSVARIVVREIGLQDPVAVQAALLHDVVEDTMLALDDLKREFGPTVATIVDGLTKISGVFDMTTTSRQAETFRKMLLSLADDFRVALIKIADRLHNIRTLGSMRRESQLKVAAETELIYAPLAHRFGLNAIKSELEDYILLFTQPEVFERIQARIAESKSTRDRYIKNFIRPIRQQMDVIGLRCEIKGRVKSISSIFHKMQAQQIPIEEVFDLFAIRIIIENTGTPEALQKAECWAAYNAITATYRPHPSRLRDWISAPKTTGYQSLHTTVMGPEGKWVEVQIRTRDMDAAAEMGIAAHWKYKGTADSDQALEHWLAKVRDLLENKQLNAKDFVKEVRASLVLEQIYVFTPKGEIKVLPVGSTVIDFAYLIHTNIGNQCIGAKVNHKLVSHGHPLRNGDQVEVLTSKKQLPQADWLQVAHTTRAQHKIKDALKDRYRELVAKGKEIFDWKARQLNISENHMAVRELLADFGIPSLLELYYRIGNHQIDVRKLQDFINRKMQHRDVYDRHPTTEAYAQFQKEEFDRLLERIVGMDADRLVVKGEVETGEYQLARCCNPIPGDEIIGFYKPSEGITIHRTTCTEAREMMGAYGSNIVKVNWAEDNLVEFLTGIRIVGQDTKGMMMKLVHVISNQSKLNIRSIAIDTKNGSFEGMFKLYVHSTNDIDKLVENLLNVKGVHGATRLQA